MAAGGGAACWAGLVVGGRRGEAVRNAATSGAGGRGQRVVVVVVEVAREHLSGGPSPAYYLCSRSSGPPSLTAISHGPPIAPCAWGAAGAGRGVALSPAGAAGAACRPPA